jgi:hypothetical protein
MSAMNGLMDQINTMGVLRFPNSFAAVQAISPDELAVSVVSHSFRFLGAVNKMAHRHINIHIIVVKRSYQQLENLTLRIARDTKSLAASGVSLQSWGPDPQSDTVRITLTKPTWLAKPGGSAGPVRMATALAALHILQARFGRSWVTVSGTWQPLAVSTSTRENGEASPVKAGDFVFYSSGDGGAGDECTSGFATTANGGVHHTYIISAGHCGRGLVDDSYNGLGMGSVATQYLDALSSDELDFETIKADVSASGEVWYGADGTSSFYDVKGVTVPAVNSSMTMDGDSRGTGQITGNTVNLANGCVSVSDSYYGTYEVCNVGEASDNASSGPKVCVPGDSGGPAYVRTTDPNVDAAGSIESTSDNGHECYFQEMSEELRAANLTLITK